MLFSSLISTAFPQAPHWGMKIGAGLVDQMKNMQPKGLLPDMSEASQSSPAMRHNPVLLDEVLTALNPVEGGIYIDGTFGAGGYSCGVLDTFAQTVVLGIDRDPDAVEAGQVMASRYPKRLTIKHGRFGDLDALAREQGFEQVDGVMLDIGVSSMQLDEAGRGFSFRMDGPLDMRMEQAGPSAADIVNEASEEELADIFYYYGEERRARAVARAIVADRSAKPFTTTSQLATLIGRVVRGEPGGIHPATRSFQALRIAVNEELIQLVEALHAAERILKPGGRLVVVTFHSLEDRLVKQFLAKRSGKGEGGSRHAPAAQTQLPTFSLITKGSVAPTQQEILRNPRARSAKLRAAERLDAPEREPDSVLASVARLPERFKKR